MQVDGHLDHLSRPKRIETARTMLSRMLAYFINNLHVVEKLAESRPIRRAAQLTAYAITKAQIAGRDASEKMLRSQTLRQVRQEAGRAPGDLGEIRGRLKKVGETFVSEVKDGWKEGSKQIKK
ncbi:protein NCBP2AS2 isoform X1 [Cololabis saira]|uniref:protein NCBP2AS2 isoform X1 n=2 Tax=Cololabis saira TaxID=129043 RepID=UPI002AD1EFBF|nr:protein NCBP2AS2 isoform X1 [Cololabis saira]